MTDDNNPCATCRRWSERNGVDAEGGVRLLTRRENVKKRSDCGTSCLTPKQVQWAYRKWCEGYPIQEIAQKLYVSPSTVYKSFKGRRRHRPPLDPPKE